MILIMLLILLEVACGTISVTYWRDVWPSYWWAYDPVICPRAVLACLPRRF